MPQKNKLNIKVHEELIFTLFMNAAYKLMAAMHLYKAGIFYDSAFALTVIAEEELAKTILVPIALETDSADELFSKKDGAFFNHRKKQKLAAVISIFEKDGSKIEERKQQALYMANSDNGMHGMNVKKKECSEELVHCIFLFFSQLSFLESAKDSYPQKVSKNLADAALSLFHLISSCMQENALDVARAAKNKIKSEAKNAKNSKRILDKNSIKFGLQSPYERIELFKTLFGVSYKQKLLETITMSTSEIWDLLIKDVDWDSLRLRIRNGNFANFGLCTTKTIVK